MSSFGMCCICEAPDATTCAPLLYLIALPGQGWGCRLCGVPNNGAWAALCSDCWELYRQAKKELRFACRGLPAVHGREPFEITRARGTFGHVYSKHSEVILH